ncbi:site-specific recombinase [Microbacterium sp. PF5]|uniref:site-specific recombinase n=1 Tax=Microbacterium sp. PF5 TaxID=2305435 RepID=UPI00144496D3|nr:site-specific recombinase [Microbacterium sp. PF5]
MTVRSRIRDHALSLFFLALFAAALIGQSIAGYLRNNDELAEHGRATIGFLDFVWSSDFAVDVAENWQSEFLQFFLFIAATIWFVQRGSPESKKPGDEGPGSDADQLVGRHARPDSPRWARAGGWRAAVFGNSLLIVMGAVFLLSWLAQSLAGTVVMNAENAQHGAAAITWLDYVVSPDFWDRTLQNWQSEFLAVGTMVAFAIYLRQRGSAESKPVGTPHHTSASESD